MHFKLRRKEGVKNNFSINYNHDFSNHIRGEVVHMFKHDVEFKIAASCEAAFSRNHHSKNFNGNTTANASPTKKHFMGFVFVPFTGDKEIRTPNPLLFVA